MYCTSGFEAESMEALKAKYAEYYLDSFVNEENIKYIVYQHDTGIEVDFSKEQMIDFINEVNEIIENNRDEDFHKRDIWTM